MLNYFASPLKCFTNSDKFLDFPHETQNDRKYDYFSSQVSRAENSEDSSDQENEESQIMSSQSQSLDLSQSQSQSQKEVNIYLDPKVTRINPKINIFFTSNKNHFSNNNKFRSNENDKNCTKKRDNENQKGYNPFDINNYIKK